MATTFTASFTDTTAPGTVPGILKITVTTAVANTIKVFWRGVEKISQVITTNVGKRIGFGINTNSTVTSGGNGIKHEVDWFKLKYEPVGGPQNNRNRVVALTRTSITASKGYRELNDSTLAVIVSIPLIFSWSSIAGPATVTIVGDALPPDRRTMAFSLQHILRRIARIGAYALAAPILWSLGEGEGVRANATVAILFVVGAAAVQFKFMKTATRDDHMTIQRPRQLLRRFHPNLKRLLAADIFARWAEGMVEPFIILMCIPIIQEEHERATIIYQSVLLSIMAATSMVCYLVIGPLASKEGLAKKPYIGLTFVFFALFPISLVVLGHALGTIGLALAFVVGGLRELGEPARKAMITDLVPPEVKTQAIGLYWSARSVAVMWAAPVGAILWVLGQRIESGFGPVLAFTTASLVGLIGAILFYIRFGKASGDTGV
ncbi:MAG: MFS transporter [Planctomycetes bacterium]|nr:MFS transporter [Planctomycetota bacterium]